MKNLVEIQSGQAVTSSRRVAQDFGKEHSKVMRSIKEILEAAGIAKTGDTLFFENEWVNPQNKQKYSEYLMNRDGFTLLVMGFTGSDALQWKLKYIKAFNEMEKQLQQHIPNLTPTTRPHYRARMINTAVRDAAATAKTIMKLFGVRDGVAQATAFKMVESAYGLDMTPVKQAIPAAKHEIGWLTPTEIGMRMGGKKASYINTMLADLGLQICEICGKKKTWNLTKSGKDYGEAFPYDAKTGHSGYQIKWNENILSLLVQREGALQ